MAPSDDGEDHAPAGASDSDGDEDKQEELEYEEVEEVEEEIEVEEDGDEDVEEYEEYEEVEEYEEEEEEEEEEPEEEEVEEEVEEEEVEEVEEMEMDVSDSPIEADEDRNDFSQDMESKGPDGQFRSGSSTLEKAEVKTPSNTLAVEESSGNFNFSSPSNEPLTTQKESSLNYEDMRDMKSGKDLVIAEDNISQEMVDKKDAEALPEEKASKDHSESHCDTKDHLCNEEILDANSSFPSSINGNETADAIPMRDHSVEGANGVLNSEEEMKHTDLQSGDHKKRLASRLAAPDTRTGSLSPGAEIKEGNKRPAVICEFFAKGWCIRGTSCRFLHKKGDLNDTAQKPEADVAAVNWKREVQLDEGLRDITERSMSPVFPEPLASSVGNSLAFSSHLTSETILPRELGESQRWNEFHGQHKLPLLEKEDSSLCITPASQQLPSSKDDPSFVSSFKDVGRDIQRQNWPADHASSNGTGSSIVRNSLLPEYGFSSSGSDLLSRKYRSGILSSHSSTVEEMTSIRSQHMHNDFTSPFSSHSLNFSSITSLPTTSMLPSHRISAWTASSLPLYSSFSMSSLGSQKLLDGEKECRASRSSSLMQISSPFSASESGNLPVTNVSLRSADHRTKFSLNDWEPSVPFRPSFFIPPMSISSPGSQYDPLRDSTESPKIGDGSFRVSLYGEGASIVDKSHLQKNGDSVLIGTLTPECNDDTTSVSSHNKFYDNVLDKSCHTRERDSLATEAETRGTSVVDWLNGTIPIEENHLGPSHAKDTTERSKINDDHASSHQNDGSRHKHDLKLGRARQDNEMDVGPKMDGNVLKESKALRHFRAALIELVKELLKPTWRDGHLSKDAHNMIVKKVVDKVLSTLQSHQVPTTMESVEQYLSSFRPKITKLVEGYVEKYGKS